MSRILRARRSTAARAATVTAAASVFVLGFGVVATAVEAASAERPRVVARPTISGPAREGATLTGNRGQWANNPFDYNFFWVRCDQNGGSCAVISGATRPTYALKRVDVGTRIRFRVEARNADGRAFASSVPTAVVVPAQQPPSPPPPPPPPAPAPGGCPAGSGTIPIAALRPPARLLLEQQQANPAVVTRDAQVLTLRYRVTACGGRPVEGALLYATATPFNQFSIPPEQPTGSDGWGELELQRLGGFPVSPVQQLVAIFTRARKPGENLLGGVSTRRLFSVRASV